MLIVKRCRNVHRAAAVVIRSAGESTAVQCEDVFGQFAWAEFGGVSELVASVAQGIALPPRVVDVQRSGSAGAVAPSKFSESGTPGVGCPAAGSEGEAAASVKR